MPDEVQREIFEVRVEGAQAQETLNRILESLRRIEQGMTNLGTQIDASVGKLIAPFTRLNESITNLNANISNLQANLGNTAAVQEQRRATQGLTVDYANLRAAMTKFRTGGTQRFRDPTTGQYMGREQLVERYMAGQYQQFGFGPTMGGAGAGMIPPTLSMRGAEMARQFRVSGGIMPELQRPMGAGLEATPETVQQEAAAVQKLNSGLARSVELRQQGVAGAQQELAAEQQIAALRKQQAARVTQITPEQESRLLAGITPEATAMRQAQEEAGRKIVTQTLLARGAKDVAEKFERQFKVTRSKAEVLREVAREGKLTAGAEKELGLQTDRTSRSTRRSGYLLRSLRNTLIRYFVIWQTMRVVKKTMADWMSAHVEMDQALAQFVWRLDATGSAAQNYSRTLISIAVETGTAVKDLAAPLGMGGDPAMLAAAARAQRLFGGEIQDWLRTLDDGTGILDAHAAAMRIAQMTTEEYSKVLQASAGMAEEWNVQAGEAAGLMAGLAAETGADEQKVVALAGALSKLYDINEALIRAGSGPAVVVGAGGAQERRPLGQIMGEISRLPVEAQRQLAREIGLTSQEQQQLFLDALAGWPQIEAAMMDTVSAAGEFDRAMAASDESLKAHVDSMKQSWLSLLGTIGDTDAFKSFINDITSLATGVTGLIGGMTESWSDYMDYLEEERGYGPLEKLVRAGGPIGFGDWLRRQQEAQLAVPTEERAGIVAGVGGMGAPAPTGPAAWQQFRVQKLPEEITIDQAVREMERIIAEEFVGVFETATGELVEVTKAQIDAERQLTLVMDEANRKPVDIYGPAWQQAVQNLQEEIKNLGRLNLERLRDISPEQFDIAMRTRLPYWEARLQQVPGFEEEEEWHNYFVGEQDVGRRQLATQTAMQYTLQDILDTEKKQLEGMWNIPAGATMRVPLQSLDLMRWMQEGAGGAPGEGFPAGPETPTDLMQPVNQAGVNLDASAMNLTESAVNLTGSATSLSDAALQFGAKIYGGVPVEPGVAREAAMEGGMRQEINRRRMGAVAGGAGSVKPTPVTLETIINLDGRQIAKTVETQYVRDLQNTSRGRVGGLRP